MEMFSERFLWTPPSEHDPALMASTVSVLRAQAEALTAVAEEYADPTGTSHRALFASLGAMHNRLCRGGKLVFTAMGKSFRIAEKLVATLTSMGISTQSLHPSEALHGDLGCLRTGDVLILITSSGSTPELINLLDHLSTGLTLICLTCTKDSVLSRASSHTIYVPVASHHLEKNIYGLAASTITTTACLAVGDAMCVTLNEMLESDAKQRLANFGRWHPGGAIGMAHMGQSPVRMLYVSWTSLSIFDQDVFQVEEVNLWRATAAAPLVICAGSLYKSSELTVALSKGHTSVKSVALDDLPRLRSPQARLQTSFCVVVNDDMDCEGIMYPA